MNLRGNTSVKWLVAVVHNNEASIPAHKVVAMLKTFQDDFQHLEISKQTIDNAVDMRFLICDAVNQHRMEKRWRSYCDSSSISKDVISVIAKLLRTINLVFSKNYRSSAWNIRQVEKAITNKHIQAWKEFSTSQFDFLLVMEADATYDEAQKIQLALTLESPSTRHPTFLNVGGGLDLNELKVKKLLRERLNTAGQELLTFSKPITNTACAYAINKSLVQALLEAATNEPLQANKALPIDWFLNSLFMHLTMKGMQIDCQHFNPPLLIHGSISENFGSWHPNRKK